MYEFKKKNNLYNFNFKQINAKIQAKNKKQKTIYFLLKLHFGFYKKEFLF